MSQGWVARWTKGDLAYSYHFTSVANRVIARIDFRLKLIDLGYTAPDEFTLEEDNTSVVERGIIWNYPILTWTS